nr:MAG TPA: hypothetical protein [Caudoviricetes sp.]
MKYNLFTFTFQSYCIPTRLIPTLIKVHFLSYFNYGLSNSFRR